MILIPIFGDQLTLENPALRNTSPTDALIVMAEVIEENISSTKMRSAVFLSAMRHFAQRLEKAGWQVAYFPIGKKSIGSLELAWDAAMLKHPIKTIQVCEPGDWRVEQKLIAFAEQKNLPLAILDDEHFLISRKAFAAWAGKTKFLRMEMFYRYMRKREGVLMHDGEPEGGQWNFDEQNRGSFGKAGPVDLKPAIRFAPDDITNAVIKDLHITLPALYGSSDQFDWPVTREQALEALDDFVTHRLSRFGLTQDAMWSGEPFLFHSLISAALNIKLLNPTEVIAAAVKSYESGAADIATVEGFVRQILGWREFMRGVYWLDMPGMKVANHLNANITLPSWFWTGKTGMNCMSQSIGQTLDRGYAHHIQRLMVVGNFALLAGLKPEQVCEWYLGVYVDAIEWVELPNTAGMALFANGGRFTTKPYIASGAYIKRMSNYCGDCKYKSTERTSENACPFTTLYWNFLDKHQSELNKNPRAALMMKNYDRLGADELQSIRDRSQWLLKSLESI